LSPEEPDVPVPEQLHNHVARLAREMTTLRNACDLLIGVTSKKQMTC
jgi:hypothetical protein